MSFIKRDENAGTVYAPGYFLADDEHCTRETRTIKADDESVKTAANGGKYVPMGATFKNGDAVEGVVFEDVDVSNGDAAGSVVTAGTIIKERLVTPADADALKTAGFKVIAEAAVTRPEGFELDTEETATDTTAETAGAKKNTAGGAK